MRGIVRHPAANANQPGASVRVATAATAFPPATTTRRPPLCEPQPHRHGGTVPHAEEPDFRRLCGHICLAGPVDNPQEVGGCGRFPRASPEVRGLPTRFASIEREPDMFSNLKRSAGLAIVVVAAAAGLGAYAFSSSNTVDARGAAGARQATVSGCAATNGSYTQGS